MKEANQSFKKTWLILCFTSSFESYLQKPLYFMWLCNCINTIIFYFNKNRFYLKINGHNFEFYQIKGVIYNI